MKIRHDTIPLVLLRFGVIFFFILFLFADGGYKYKKTCAGTVIKKFVSEYDIYPGHTTRLPCGEKRLKLMFMVDNCVGEIAVSPKIYDSTLIGQKIKLTYLKKIIFRTIDEKDVLDFTLLPQI